MIVSTLAGFLSGIISGMGIGGGAVLIPVLTVFLGFGQRDAQFVNLIYFIPTAVSALYKHRKNDCIDKTVLKPLIIFGLAGCVGGALFASKAGDGVLRLMFAVFLGFMGVYEIIKGGKGDKTNGNK